MNINSLRPAKELAHRFGVKAIIYGQPGTGKTPMLNTCPRPVLLATEAGLGSMRDSNLPTFDAYTPARIEEFFEWFLKSREASNFDTLAIDSGSQLAETILARELDREKHGKKAYGEMAKHCMEWFDALYFMPQKHIIVNCKMMKAEAGKTIVQQGGAFTVEVQYQSQPYFPGQALNISVPHRFDQILYVAEAHVPGIGKTTAIHTKGGADYLARDRFGNLAALEEPHLGKLIQKAMS